MTTHHSKPARTLGFLTIVESPAHGFFGGYLMLNEAGRPLEFHCTAPIRPNRAQEILYGPTLRPFLCGEQIGQTLLSQGKSQPHVIYTDVAAVVEVRRFIEQTVVLVLPPSPKNEEGEKLRVDAPHQGLNDISCALLTFQINDQNLAVCARYENDRQTAHQQFDALGSDFDLTEPFDRIRYAIDEAQPK